MFSFLTTKGINNILPIVKLVTLFSLIIAILASLSYLTTYSFLYNYYFGGDLENLLSTFSTIKWFVPFHNKTLIYTNFIIILSTTLMTYIIYLILEKEVFKKILAFLYFIIFHSLLFVFFVNDININNLLNFSVIWLLPLAIGAFILMIKIVLENPLKLVSGMLYVLIIIIVTSMFFVSFKLEHYKTSLINFGYFLFFSLPLLIGRIPYKNMIYKFFFIFPITWALIIALYFTLSLYAEKFLLLSTIPTLIFALLILPIIITYFFSRKYGNRMQDIYIEFPKMSNLLEVGQKLIPTLISQNYQKITLVPIALFIMCAYILIPKISGYVAINIRNLTENNEQRLQIINLRDSTSKSLNIKGSLITEFNGVIYISNEFWELEHIKTDYYYINYRDGKEIDNRK